MSSLLVAVRRVQPGWACLGLLLVAAPSTALADDEIIQCFAHGVYEVCADGMCTTYPVEHFEFGPDEQTAGARAIAGCTHHVTNMVVTNNLASRASVHTTCAVSRCGVFETSGAAALERERYGGGGSDDATGARQEDGDAASQNAGDIAECAPLIEILCELCGDDHDACRLVETTPATAEECISGADELEGIAAELAAAPELVAEIVPAMCEEMGAAMAAAQ